MRDPMRLDQAEEFADIGARHDDDLTGKRRIGSELNPTVRIFE